MTTWIYPKRHISSQHQASHRYPTTWPLRKRLHKIILATTYFLLLELSTLGASSLPIFIPQQASQDLSTWALGNGINELNASLEPLVVGLVFLNMLDDLGSDLRIRSRRHGWWRHDKGFGHFSVTVVGNSDDSAVIYGGMGEEVGFKLGGRNLVSLKEIPCQYSSEASWGYDGVH